MAIQMVISIKRKGNREIGKLGNRGYLMPIIFDRNDIQVAPNEIFYTTANAAQLRGRTFLTQKRNEIYGKLHAE